MTIRKFLPYFAYAVLTIAMSLMILVGYWWLAPYTPIKFNTDKQGKLTVANNKVPAGGQITINMDYCKYSKDIPEVSRDFSDGIIYDIPDSPASEKPLGCVKQQGLQLEVPKSLPPGIYTIKSTYRYQVNPLRVVDVSVSTEPFTVTTATSSGTLAH
jgi:hypothetical protein